MKRLLLLSIILFTLLVAIAAFFAYFQKGLDAYFQKGLAAARNGDFATALREWKPLAEQGHAESRYNLGVMYDKGQGVPQNYKIAVKWYKLAAEQGYARAQSNLGWMYAKGNGVPQDYKTAVKWCKLAAEQGNVESQNSLGMMYYKGLDVRDPKTAIKWYKLAAEQGYARAQYNLGWMYAYRVRKVNGTLKDYIYAHMWGNLAAAKGNKKGGKLRDEIAKRMTTADISTAQRLARECVQKNYKGC